MASTKTARDGLFVAWSVRSYVFFSFWGFVFVVVRTRDGRDGCVFGEKLDGHMSTSARLDRPHLARFLYFASPVPLGHIGPIGPAPIPGTILAQACDGTEFAMCNVRAEEEGGDRLCNDRACPLFPIWYGCCTYATWYGSCIEET